MGIERNSYLNRRKEINYKGVTITHYSGSNWAYINDCRFLRETFESVRSAKIYITRRLKKMDTDELKNGGKNEKTY